MTKTVVTRAGLAFAALSATMAVAAPHAAADPVHRGACLHVANDTDNHISIVVNTAPIGNEAGYDYEIDAHSAIAFLDRNGNYLLSPDGSWSLNGPDGSWEYDDQFREGACNGVWNFTVG